MVACVAGLQFTVRQMLMTMTDHDRLVGFHRKRSLQKCPQKKLEILKMDRGRFQDSRIPSHGQNTTKI